MNVTIYIPDKAEHARMVRAAREWARRQGDENRRGKLSAFIRASVAEKVSRMETER